MRERTGSAEILPSALTIAVFFADGFPHIIQDMRFADIELSRLIEKAEGQAGCAYAEARRKLQPDAHATWQEISGALAIFDGPGSPVTQTFGLGLFGPVTATDLDQVEAFFFERGAHVNHEISPLADPSLWPLLTARGYTPIEFTSMLYRDLAAFPPLAAPDSNVQVRPINAEQDGDTFIRVNLEGWSETPGLDDFLNDLIRIMLQTEGLQGFLAFSGDEAIAAGSLNLRGPVAMFAGACTIPSARGRGAQRALLEERLRTAVRAGCKIAVMGAQAGSGSQRNAERAGFRIAYTRTKWQRPINTPL